MTSRLRYVNCIYMALGSLAWMSTLEVWSHNSTRIISSFSLMKSWPGKTRRYCLIHMPSKVLDSICPHHDRTIERLTTERVSCTWNSMKDFKDCLILCTFQLSSVWNLCHQNQAIVQRVDNSLPLQTSRQVFQDLLQISQWFHGVTQEDFVYPFADSIIKGNILNIISWLLIQPRLKPLPSTQ